MSETTATRTLVKSPPELWAECSEASSLSRHLPAFGQITIIKLDPETAVAWEGERISGTVRIEPSGWGTRVTLTATAETVEAEAVAPEPEPVAAEPEPVAADPERAVPEPEPAAAQPEPQPQPAPMAPPPPPARKGGWLARLVDLFRPAPAVHTIPPPVTAEPEPVAAEPEPVPAEPEPQPEPGPAAPSPAEAPSPAAELAEIEAALSAALDSLGQAHHRPFSRA